MLFIALLMFSLPQSELSQRQFCRKVDHLLGSPAMADSFWGVMVYAPMRQKVIYKRLENKNFRPASNMKILTTLMGFEFLGANYQFQTALYYRGNWDRQSGILDGDLILEGRGDPSLSGNYGGGDALTEALIRSWLADLKEQGLREIRGNLIALTNYFDQTTIQKSWEWDDMGTSYGTPVTPLSLHDGRIQIELWANETGQPHYSSYPPWISDLDIQFQTLPEAAAMDLEIRRTWGTNQLIVTGDFPPCAHRELTISAWDPTQHFLETFRALMDAEGIALDGGLRTIQDAPDAPITLIDTLESPAFATLAQTLMKASQNHYADLVMKTVAREAGGEGSFEKGSEIASQFIRHVYTSLGQPDPTLLGANFRDGSGLSAQNYLRPAYLVQLLRYGLEQPYASEWLATFPVMGKAGTLSRRGIENSPSLGRVRAKTGYIYRTRTLSGYVETLAGEPLIFSLMANNYSALTAEVNRIQDHICDLMVRLKPNRTARRQMRATAFPEFFPENLSQGSE